jgi:hypothetical protein
MASTRPFDCRSARQLPQLVCPQGFPKGEIGQLLALMQELDHNGLSGLLEPIRKAAGLPPRAQE